MEILISSFYLFVFLFLIYRMKFFKLEGIHCLIIPSIFILKVFSGMLMSYIYKVYYKGGDLFSFFNDGNVMFRAIYSQPRYFFQMLFGIDGSAHYLEPYYSEMSSWCNFHGERDEYSANHLIIRFNAFLRLFSAGYFTVHLIFINFVSLLGLTAIYKAFIPYLSDKKKELIIVVFLVPSVLLQGSVVLKESLLLFSLGMLIYYFLQLINKQFSFKASWWMLLSIYIIVFTRVYIFLAIVPSLLAYWWIVKSKKKNPGIKYLIVFSLYLLFGLNVQYFFPTYNALAIITQRQNNYIAVANGGTYLSHKSLYVCVKDRNALIPVQKGVFKIKPGTSYYYWDIKNLKDTLFVAKSNDTLSYHFVYEFIPSESRILMERLKPTMGSFFRACPMSIINSVFRPFLFEANTTMTMMAAIENTILFLFISLSIVFHKKNRENKELLYLCLMFAFIALLITGLTTPVLGAIVRFKVPILPFLLIAALWVLDKEKLFSMNKNVRKSQIS